MKKRFEAEENNNNNNKCLLIAQNWTWKCEMCEYASQQTYGV